MLGRLDNADALLAQAEQRNIKGTGLYVEMARSAILRGDAATTARMEELAKASPEGELRVLDQHAQHAGALGQIAKVHELRTRTIERAKGLSMSDFAADQLANEANAEAEVGYQSHAAEHIDAALALSRNPDLLAAVADAAAAAGLEQKAESLMDEARRARHDDTILKNVIAARVHARSQLRHRQSAAAIQTLASAQNYEEGRWFNTHILRGQAYLAAGQLDNAIAEFQKFLARRALAPFSIYYPLAQLGMARALAAQHNTSQARTAYQDFFAMWKDAVNDIPILKVAKADYTKLQ